MSISACSRDATDLVAYAEQVKARPGSPIKPIEIDPIPIPPAYGQTRDPFESFIEPDVDIVRVKHPEKPPWPGHNPEELERFALDSLRMVGTFRHNDTHWGLIKSPDGVIHRVKAGNFVGKNFGRIREIGETQIVLLEKVSDGRGSWEDRDASMSLVQ